MYLDIDCYSLKHYNDVFAFTPLRVFGSVVVVAFQIAFRAEIHANDVFLFFKNYF
jgi:hypothetical protein